MLSPFHQSSHFLVDFLFKILNYKNQTSDDAGMVTYNTT